MKTDRGADRKARLIAQLGNRNVWSYDDKELRTGAFSSAGRLAVIGRVKAVHITGTKELNFVRFAD
jgi:hypothetical protein